MTVNNTEVPTSDGANLPAPPQSESKYMKWQLGDNKFRFLSVPVSGYEGWIKKKPHRFKTVEETEGMVFEKSEYNPSGKAVFFWVAKVWNYAEERIQILEIKQISIIKFISALSKDPDWGGVLNYDIKVTKTVKGDDTTYETMGIPPKPLPKEILAESLKTPVDMEKFYTDEDPFDVPKNLDEKGKVKMPAGM